jgi:L-ascorbate metabolism protein UlaG (beta-lactamase superfamily)
VFAALFYLLINIAYQGGKPMEHKHGGIKIEWYGHACFALTMDNGFSIIIDPFDGMPYTVPKLKNVWLALATHSHFDHNNVSGVNAESTIIGEGETMKFGSKTVKGKLDLNKEGKEISIWGIGAFHDKGQGKQRGPNTIFVLKIEDILIAHLGDLGHVLKEEQLEKMREIGPIDVLFIPVGGHFTIDEKEATKVVEQLSPKLVFPMHYKTNILSADFPIVGVDKFLKGKSNVERIDSSDIAVTKDELPDKTMIVVLKYHDE